MAPQQVSQLGFEDEEECVGFLEELESVSFVKDRTCVAPKKVGAA